MKFTLYPIHWVARQGLDPEPFDPGILPFEVIGDVRIEAVEFREGAFNLHRQKLGTEIAEVMERVRYALVHRYEPETTTSNGRLIGEVQHSKQSDQLVREIAALLRVIHPMRQHALMMRGQILDDGKFDVMGFDAPNLWMHEPPEVQKLWTLRNRDCNDLRSLTPAFLGAMNGEIWKFRMAVQFHEFGFFESHPEQWKARLLLWASAIESIFTSTSRGHQGTAVATERIKWFLGEHTSIYAPGDLNEFEEDPHLSLGELANAIYNVRNFVAHGDRVPDFYFKSRLRNGMNGSGMFMEVLFEAQSFIIRKSLIKILQSGLQEEFANASAAEAYFTANGLTNTQIRARQKAILGN